MQKKVSIFLMLNVFVIVCLGCRFGGDLWGLMKQSLAIKFYNSILEIYMPSVILTESEGQKSFCGDLSAAMFPSFSYHRKQLWYDAQMEGGMDYENLAARENHAYELMVAENQGAGASLGNGTSANGGLGGGTDDIRFEITGGTGVGIGIPGQTAENGGSLPGGQVVWGGSGMPGENGVLSGPGAGASLEQGADSQSPGNGTPGMEPSGNEAPGSGQSGSTEGETSSQGQQGFGRTEKLVSINREKLNDFDYLRQNFYIVDSGTTTDGKQLNAEKLLGKDMRVSKAAPGPQILIYHTHSQEGYKDSKTEGDPATSVVAVGDYLTKLLTEQYGFSVLHHKGEYDVNGREHAYSNAAPALEKLLSENPSIQLVIDLHRDSVGENTHLLTEIDGKPTAKIMFFNGLSFTTTLGKLTNLPNPNLEDNLSLSLQMQLAAAEYYPNFTRKIYLKGYRYNMHYLPKSMLIEVGAENNTFEEAKNAMEPLADILNKVLTGTQ